MEAGIGIVAGVAGLIQISTQITTLIYGYVQDVRRATKNQKAYLSEVSALIDVLLRFDKALQDAGQHLGTDIARPSDDTIQQCHDRLERQRAKLQKHTNRFVWPLEAKDLRKAIEDLHRFREIFAGYLTASTSSLATAALSGVDALQKTQARDTLLDTLRQETLVFRPNPEALSGTGTWLLQHTKYKAWVESSTSVLWCYGAPGVGKSSLASLVIKNLAEKQSQNEQPYALYHFCNFASRQQETGTVILQDLLSQLVEQGDDVAVSYLYAQRHFLTSRSSTFKDIAHTMAKIPLKRPVYLVVDGLDEVQNPKPVAAWLLSLVKSNWKVLVTSRDHPDIRATFDQASAIEICADREDIRKFVIDRFQDSDFADTVNESHSLVDSLLDRTDGLFILAKLLTDRLLTCTNIKQMRRALDSSPASLAEAYSSSLERIKTSEANLRDLTLRLISWIVNAHRPFHPQEVIHALALEPGDEEIDEESLTRLPTLLRNCAGLVVLNQKFNSLELVHATAYEYFASEHEAVKQVHADVASTALNYLALNIFRSEIHPNIDEMSRRNKIAPFLLYAGRFWGVHMLKSGAEDQLYGAICKVLKHDGLRANSFLALFYQDVFADRAVAAAVFSDVPSGHTELHAAAYWGLVNTTKRLIVDGGVDPNTGNSQGWVPLHWAAHNSHHEVCRVLLDRGADPNAQDERGWTPLFWSSFYCNAAITNLLLSRGTDHTIKDLNGWTALHWAVSKGEAESVRLLLLHHAQKYPAQALSRTRDHRGEPMELAASETLLEIAATENDLNMFDILLNAHMDTEKPDFEALWTTGCFDPPLGDPWRTMNKAEKLYGVEVYLRPGRSFRSKDLSVENKDQWKGRLVHSAIKDDQLSGLRLLLELGADPNYQLGKAPLHAAAFRQNPEYTRLLLRFGADVNTQDTRGRTALHQAVLNGFVDTVRVLIEEGADVNIRVGDSRERSGESDQRRTPLMLACGLDGAGELASNSRANMVDHLIAAQADAELLDTEYRSALHCAIEVDDLSITRKLLHLGLDVNQTDVNGISPIHLAAETCNADLVELLVDSGADAFQTDKTGMNCFHFCAIGSERGRKIEDLRRLLGLLLRKTNSTLLNAVYEQTWRNLASSKTPLSLAIENGNWKTFQVMADAGAELPPDALNLLGNAVSALYAPAVSFILANGQGASHQRHDSAGRMTVNIVEHLRTALSHKPFDHDVFDQVTSQVVVTEADRKSFGETMLHSAVSSGHNSTELAAVLLKHGCDPLVKDKSGFDAFLACALRHSTPTMLRYLLLEAPQNSSEGHWTRHLKDSGDLQADTFLRVCEALKKADGQPDTDVPDTVEILKEAIEFGNEPFSHALIDAGIGCTGTDQYGWSVLHYAIQQERKSIVSRLLEQYPPLIHVAAKQWATVWDRPAGLSVGTKWTGTPLHLAVLTEQKDLILRLLEMGVNINARTDEYGLDGDDGGCGISERHASHGPTALRISLHNDKVYHIAPGGLNEDQLFIARMLLEHGANVEGAGEHLQLTDRPKFRLFEDVWEKVYST